MSSVDRHVVGAVTIASAGAAAVFLAGHTERSWYAPPDDSFGMGFWRTVHPWWTAPAACVSLLLGLVLAWLVVTRPAGRRVLAYLLWGWLEASDDAGVSAFRHRSLGMARRDPSDAALRIGDDIGEALGRDAEYPSRLICRIREVV
jgi:hypothetical protein